jgi:hypothetical protein
MASLHLRGATLAMEGPPPILDPATHISTSSEYSLYVNPSDLHGRGSADYEFSRNGKVLWTNHFPFTYWDVGVANSGYIAGYAYSHGWRGFSKDGFKAGAGDFSVIIMSPEGTIITQEQHSRVNSRFLDTPPTPLAAGIFVDDYSHRAIVRMADPDLNQGIEQWWIYDLKNGTRVGTQEPATHMINLELHRLSILAASALPSTPLTLIHWWQVDYPRIGGIFTLVDPLGKPVWMLTLEDDYAMPEDDSRENEIRQFVWEGGGILNVKSNGMFEIFQIKEGLRASFAAKQHESGTWTVDKTGATPYLSPSPEVAPTLPAYSLRALGEIPLSVPGHGETKNQIRNLVSFEFSPDGSICVIKAGADSHPHLWLLTQQGEVLMELRLPVNELPELVGYSNPANVGGRKFVIGVSGRGVGGTAEYFRADFDTGVVEIMTNASSPRADALAGFSDGSFVALTTRYNKYSMTDGLYFFEPDGTMKWNMEKAGYSGNPAELLSPEDVITFGTNEIAVLDNIRHTIQLFNTEGNFLRTINLAEAWGRKPNYPTDLAPDMDGGFIVYDFNAKQTLLCLDTNGAITSASVPTRADGRLFRVIDGIKRSPQGDLWTSDGDSLYRLSTNGAADLTIGEEPEISRLNDPGYMNVGLDDRVYIADQRTKSVHVFDAQGKHIGPCVPNAEDLTDISSIKHIAVSVGGDVFVSMDFSDEKYLHFLHDQSRAGWSNLTMDLVSQYWHFQPTNHLCWVVGYRDVFLVNDLRDTIRCISRRPDGRWLAHPGRAAVAPDGSLAVMTGSGQGDIEVHLYSPTGEAQGIVRIPGDHLALAMAFDGQHIYIRTKDGVLIYETSGNPSGLFSLNSKDGAANWSGPFLAAQGSEIWFISAADYVIHRYQTAAPEER